ncbi:hypothetical protein OSTOST_09331, partial [Ostertagia ostertagi]
YRNCGLLEPFVLAVGVVGSLITDDLPNPLELRRAFWTRYGSLRFRCNSTVPFPKDGLPSVLNLFELDVAGNVMFRICACLPVAVRLFVVHCRSTESVLQSHSYSSLREHADYLCCHGRSQEIQREGELVVTFLKTGNAPDRAEIRAREGFRPRPIE